MNEWQQSFLRKLEKARKIWLKQFEQALDSQLAPTVQRIAEFLVSNGFRVTAPKSDAATRYRFALSENGYALFTFRLRGLDEVEMYCEPFVPGLGAAEPYKCSVSLYDATEAWFESSLRQGLDTLLNALIVAGCSTKAREGELQPA